MLWILVVLMVRYGLSEIHTPLLIFCFLGFIKLKWNERKSPKKYFFHISFWCLILDTSPDFTSNKPTHYLLDYVVFSRTKQLLVMRVLASVRLHVDFIRFKHGNLAYSRNHQAENEFHSAVSRCFNKSQRCSNLNPRLVEIISWILWQNRMK